MAFERVRETLSGDVPGTAVELNYFRLGPTGAPRKVHLQAALHADEQPGTMVLHHLLPMLQRADDEGRLRARFTVMPMVNPLGMANFSFRKHVGRYDHNTGVNYNRRWPDLFAAVGVELAGKLTGSAEANVLIARAAVGRWLADQAPRTAAEALRLIVMRESHDADIVLDLHCDDESLIHIFTSPELMPGLQDLADWMGARATLLAADSGGASFDEVLPRFYRSLASANPDSAIPIAAETATLEYRGGADVFDHLGKSDADRLYGFLVGRGLIEDTMPARPASMPAGTPLEATEMLRVPHAGMLAYRVDLGQQVSKGDVIADLIALDGPDAFTVRTPIRAGTDGFVLSRVTSKYVPRGASIAKIVGTEPIPSRTGGYLLED